MISFFLTYISFLIIFYNYFEYQRVINHIVKEVKVNYMIWDGDNIIKNKREKELKKLKEERYNYQLENKKILAFQIYSLWRKKYYNKY